MVTNPNTCGLFERDVRGDFARLTHAAGAYFYGDGANFNAIVGRVRPGDLGVDAMHINLHKTFSTPHGGGGPGAGPVVLSEALAPFAPKPLDRRTMRQWPGRCWRTSERHVKAPSAACAAFHGQMGMFTPRLRLHAEPWLATACAQVARGRGAKRQLPEGPPLRRVLSAALPRRPLHARGPVRRRLAGGDRASPPSTSPRR